MIDPASIIDNPEWLPHRYDAETRTVRFVHAPRAHQRQATFLDDEGLADAAISTPLPISALALVRSPAPTWIFHSAFCCSTLLARALDLPGRVWGLKEPRVLNDLAGAALQDRLDYRDLATITNLLARPLAEGERVIIKPSNEVNTLMLPLMKIEPEARAVLLSSSTADFLMSVAKKGMWGRSWVRQQFLRMRLRARRDPGFSAADLFVQTDLQIAAMVWLMHREQFHELFAALPDRVASLESETLLAHPTEAIGAVLTMAGAEANAAELHAMHAAAFGEHAKERGRGYDLDIRAAEQRHQAELHADEIELACRWLQSVAAHIGQPTAMANRLALKTG